jgi:hypothetical protein
LEQAAAAAGLSKSIGKPFRIVPALDRSNTEEPCVRRTKSLGSKQIIEDAIDRAKSEGQQRCTASIGRHLNPFRWRL